MGRNRVERDLVDLFFDSTRRSRGKVSISVCDERTYTSDQVMDNRHSLHLCEFSLSGGA
jgi:hypothetical protein